MTGKPTKISAVRGGRQIRHVGSGEILVRDSSGRFIGRQADGRKPRGRVVPSVDPPLPEPPLPEHARDGMRRVAPVKALRWKLNLSQEEFAVAYGIPLVMLKAWERRTAEPNEVESAYLGLIERDPERAKMATA